MATETAAELFLPDLPVPVFTDTHWKSNPEDPLHIRLLQDTDRFIVAPATATTLARAAATEQDAAMLQKIIDPHVQCSCEGVYLGRHTLRVGTLASVQLPLGINHLEGC